MINSKKSGILLLLIISLAFSVACNKDDSKNPLDPEGEISEYLVFGHFRGLCHGEACIETYMLKEGKLFEDTQDRYFITDEFLWVQLSHELYQSASDLETLLPQELVDIESKTFGIPDSYDQGGYYIEYKKENSEAKVWRIDTDKSSVPDFLHLFMDELNKRVDHLSKSE